MDSNYMKVGPRKIGESEPVFIIAEVGINHNGDVAVAKKLIEAAKNAGADCVKFQKRTTDKLLIKEALEAKYDSPNAFAETYGEHREVLEFGKQQFGELKDFADKVGILFAASGWDEDSVQFLAELGVPFLKIASGDFTNEPLLKQAKATGLPLIVSTGMVGMKEVKQIYELLTVDGEMIGLLQCTSSYPAPDAEINLRVIETFRARFEKAVVGYSGHELGDVPSLGAVALGAKILERHFTIDKKMKGSDHAASLEPLELSQLVQDVRRLERALGEPNKLKQASEKASMLKLTKSVVTARAIRAGEVITPEMLTVKGPGGGISPMEITEVVGSKVKHELPADSMIKYEDVVVVENEVAKAS